MKVFSIIMGVLLVIGGFYCVLTPIATYASIGWLIGASMVIEGVGSLVIWNSARKTGDASGLVLAGGILSLVLGVFLLGSYALQVSVDLFIAYVLALWLVVAGFARIFSAVAARSSLGAERASGWVIQLILGALVVIMGIMCLINPVSMMISVGLMLGASILLVGVQLIASSVVE